MRSSTWPCSPCNPSSRANLPLRKRWPKTAAGISTRNGKSSSPRTTSAGFCLAIVIVQRIVGQRPAFTIRRTIRSNTPASALEWAMVWEAQMLSEGATQTLLSAKPLAAPGIEIVVRHTLRDGEICQDSFTLSIEQPFATDCKVQPWMAALLPRCDGKTTVADLFEIAKQNGWIVPETPAEEFCRLLATLISGGFLQTEEFRLPVAAK